MDDVTQICVGKHMTGIIGLESALAAAAPWCQVMTAGRIGGVLLEMLDGHNYIETGLRDVYAQTFIGFVGADILLVGYIFNFVM